MAEKQNANIENEEKKGGSPEPQAKNAGKAEPSAENAGSQEKSATPAKNAGKTRKDGFFQKEISAAKFRKVFLIALFISGVAVLVAALCGFSLVVIDTSVGDRIFGDFWETARFSLAKNPYGEAYRSSYPPAAFLPMAPFALICKDALSLSMAEASKTSLFVLSVSLFYALNFALCGMLLCRLTKTKVFSPDGALRFLAVGASFPAVFMIARGNVIILSLLFLLLFLNFYESPSRALRLFACLFLGIAGAMKLYVLAFALLYVRRGRMQSALLTAVFFAAAFFLPFLFYGKGALSEWWLHMNGFLGDTSGMAHANSSRLGYENLSFIATAVCGGGHGYGAVRSGRFAAVFADFALLLPDRESLLRVYIIDAIAGGVCGDLAGKGRPSACRSAVFRALPALLYQVYRVLSAMLRAVRGDDHAARPVAEKRKEVCRKGDFRAADQSAFLRVRR